jgi:hypothetical protein
MALLMSGFLDIWFLVASFGTWYLIEHIGRRRLFLVTAAGMAVVMAVFAAMLKIDNRASGIVAGVMLFLYVSLFTWGWMGGCWVPIFLSLPFYYLLLAPLWSNTLMINRYTPPKSYHLSGDPKEWASQ